MLQNVEKNIFFYAIIYAIISILLLVPTHLSSQELPSNISNLLTTEQLEEYRKRTKETEPIEVNNLPTSKMPTQQNLRTIEKEDQLKSIQEKIIRDQKDKSKEKKSFLNYYYEILTQDNLEIFGTDSFSSNEDNTTLFYNTLGENYQLAPGDVIQVITRGLSELTEEAQINNLGQLTIPQITPFVAHGKTLIEIQEHIEEELKREDASAAAYVSLSAARLVQVKITGEVNEPQTIAVPAYTPLSQVLSKVGGITEMGSLRNIIVTNTQQVKERVDLYKLLRESEDFNEPLITASSRIHVSDIGSTVAVTGFVGRPKIFELPYAENQIQASELMHLANSKFTPSGTTFEVLKFDDKGLVDSKKYKSLTNIHINEGEALKISFTEIRNLKEVRIKGSVLKPFSVVSNKNGVSLKEVLKNGATLKRDALKRIALIYSNENQKETVKLIDLREVFTKDGDTKIYPGDTVEILNESEYQELLNNIEDKLIFQDTSLITKDNKVIALIPNHPKQTISSALRSQLFLSKDISKDFAIIAFSNPGKQEVIKSIRLAKILTESKAPPITGKIEINLFTNEFLTNQLTALDQMQIINDGLERIRKTNPTEIFIDGTRIGILPSGVVLSKTDIIKRLRINKGLYPLFARITSHDQSKLKIKKSFLNTDLFQTIFNDGASKTKSGQRYDFFSLGFVRNLFVESEEVQSTSLKLLSSDTETIISESTLNLSEEPSSRTNETEKIQTTKYTLAALKRASRLITGAVENPGFYPIADRVSLSDLIEVAGGTLPGSDLARISIRKYETNAKGISNIAETLVLDSTSVDVSKIFLSGSFDVTIPSVVNDAAIGIVKVSGEVLRPGEYLVSRNETLLDVIGRAGGLTDVAYPLGLTFTRTKLKEQEKQTNLVLANRIEQSIISLSQSQQEGAGDQINAVLTYAKQLREMPSTGRQTVNYANLFQTDNIYLENDDNIFIPKRPSHVSVSGRVQNATIASYEKNKKIDDYINDAGGLDRIADEKNIFLTLPNGQSLTQKTLKETGGIIPPGSVIIVPPKTDKLSLLGLTEVFSKVLGNIATSILAINAVSN